MCPAFGCGAPRWPLAIMLSADRVPVKSSRSRRSGASGLSCPWPTGMGALQVFALSNFVARIAPRVQIPQAGGVARIRFVPRHHRPGDPRHLVGQRDRRDLHRSALHQLHQPWMARVAELLGAPDHRERSDDENWRRYRFPALLMLPSFSLPPVEFCLGTSPIQALRSRPERKTFGSGMLATRAVEMSGPTPGIASRLRLRLLRDARPDPPIHLQDLPLHQFELRCQRQQADSCLCRNDILIPLGDDLEQSLHTHCGRSRRRCRTRPGARGSS